MRLAIFDALLRGFMRMQATLVMWPMAALPLADGNAMLGFLGAAMATDLARWALGRSRWLPLASRGALICCALALGIAAIAGGAASLPLPSPADPAAALGQVAWRIVTAERFLLRSAGVVAPAILAWISLNAVSMHRESHREEERRGGGASTTRSLPGGASSRP